MHGPSLLACPRLDPKKTDRAWLGDEGNQLHPGHRHDVPAGAVTAPLPRRQGIAGEVTRAASLEVVYVLPSPN
jgi:hypothetical protein